TTSPTIWAWGSIVRLPMRIRWPSRKRSASSSLIAVWAISSVGCVLIDSSSIHKRASAGGAPATRRPATRTTRSGEPHVGQREAVPERIGRIRAVLEDAGDPRLARDRGHDGRASSHDALGG